MSARWIGIAAAGVLVTACAEDPHVQNSALGGAVIGGPAGAAIGAAKGCADVGGCGGSAHRQYYDSRAGRYYYYDSRSGRYYWEDGEPRG